MLLCVKMSLEKEAEAKEHEMQIRFNEDLNKLKVRVYITWRPCWRA